MARYFDITVRNDKTNSSTSFWADSFSLNDNAILSVYSRDCGDIKVKIEKHETLTIETVDVKEEWEEMMEYYEQIEKGEPCDVKETIC